MPVPLALTRASAIVSAVVVDEAHREVPVGARRCRPARSPSAVFFAPSFFASAVNCARLVGTLDPGLLEQVGAVRDDARARVVRDAVELAAVATRLGQALEPVARVRRTTPCRTSGPGTRPAAMYFVISVFPISMTSGALPPASVASNFCRWLRPRLVLDVRRRRPGWSFWNCALAAATSSGQPVCASVCSQTVMLFAGDSRSTSAGRRRRHDRERARRARGGEDTYVHATISQRHLGGPRRTAADECGRARLGPPSGLYHSATGAEASHISRSSVKTTRAHMLEKRLLNEHSLYDERDRAVWYLPRLASRLVRRPAPSARRARRRRSADRAVA